MVLQDYIHVLCKKITKAYLLAVTIKHLESNKTALPLNYPFPEILLININHQWYECSQTFSVQKQMYVCSFLKK